MPHLVLVPSQLAVVNPQDAKEKADIRIAHGVGLVVVCGGLK